MTNEVSKNDLIICIVEMARQDGMIDDYGELNNMGLSAYETAESILVDLDLTIKVRWQECSIITLRDRSGRMPGIYFDQEKFNRLCNEKEVRQ